MFVLLTSKWRRRAAAFVAVLYAVCLLVPAAAFAMSDSLPPPSPPDLPPPTPPPVVPAAPLPPVIPAAEIPPPPPPPTGPADGSDTRAGDSEEKTLGLVMYLLPLLGLGSWTHIGGIALMAVALVAIGVLFLREARLRRASQQLLVRLLSHWKTVHDESTTPDARRAAPGDAARRRL